jgi:putative photosynthetic complex assembly protein
MPQTISQQPRPRGGLIATGLLAGCVILGLLVGKIEKVELAPPDARPEMMRDLRFADRGDGAILVIDAPSDRVVDVLEPGEDGFVRGLLRGLARERRRLDIDPDAPFRMVAWSDGRLSLEDTVTGHRAELMGTFGATNTESALRLLAAGSAPQ